MSKKLPFVKSDIPRDLRVFLDRVRELVSGSGSDRLISAGELASGVLTGSLVAPSGSTGSSGQPYLAAPPAPVDVTATAAVRSIFVEWDAPAYNGHAYAEVWSASTNSLAAAVLLGMAPGSIYVDETGPGATRYYWVRFVNTNDVKGPYNATSGTSAATAPEVNYLLGQLTGQIAATQLNVSLNSRIDLIDGPAGTPGTIPNQLAFLQGQVDAITAYPDYDNAVVYDTDDIVKYNGGLYKAISSTIGNVPTDTTYWLKIGDYSSLADVVAAHTAELVVVTNDINAEVFAREQLGAQVNDPSTGLPATLATLTNDYSTTTAVNEAIASSATELKAFTNTTASRTFRQNDEPTKRGVDGATDIPLQVGDVWYDTDDQNKMYQWDGMQWAYSPDGAVIQQITNLGATLTTEYLTAADTDTAIASSATELKAYTNTTVSRTFRQNDAPTKRGVDGEADIPLQIGDVWYDTNDQNKLYQWGGSAWVYSPDGAVVQQITNLGATLTNDYLTQTDTENAIAQSGTFLRAYADIQSKVFRQSDAPTKRGVDPETAADISLETGDVWYDTNDSNKLYLWSGSAWVYSPDAVITGSVTAVDSRVTTVESTKIGYCTIGGLATDNTNKADCEAAGGTWNVGIPLATAVKQVSISDGSTTATLETRATAQKTLNDGLKLQYTIKLDANGYVAGYGIYSDSTGSSEFIANVNRFAVTTPQTSIPLRANSTTYAVGAIARVTGQDSKTLVCKVGGTTGGSAPTIGAIGSSVTDGSVRWQVASRVPFAVQAVPTQINGQDVPAGVYFDAGYILNATIQNAQIADLAVDNAKIANLSVNKLTAGSLSADQYIQSSNYIAGTSGFRLDANGNAEFGAASIRGQITAEQIDSRRLTIKDTSGKLLFGSGGLTMQGLSGNLLRNSGFEDGIAGSIVGYYNTVTTPNIGWNLNAQYSLKGQGLAFIVVPGTPTLNTVFDFNVGEIPVTPNTRYEASALINCHRCEGVAHLVWLDVDKAYISEVAGNAVSYSSEVYALSDLRLSGVFTTSPANAAYCYVQVRSYVKAADPYSFIKNIYFGLASAAQTDYTPYSPGRGLGQITTANASTYIANAAIGSAQIGQLTANNIAAGTITAASGIIADAAITNAKIDDLQVSTFKIQGNAVTVPTSVTRYDQFYGVPAGISIIDTTITINSSCWVFASVTIAQGFPSGDRAWDTALYINNVNVFQAGGQKTADSVAMSGATYVSVTAGSTVTLPIVVLHAGSTQMIVSNRTLYVIGAKK